MFLCRPMGENLWFLPMADRRATLQFEEGCERFLVPLLQPFGFRRVSSDVQMVSYKSPRVTLEVWHGPRDFVLEINLLHAGTGLSMWLSALEALGRTDTSGPARPAFQASSPERVSEGLKSIAMYLKQHGSPALEGDESFFRRCIVAERERAERTAAAQSNSEIRTAASAAWKRGDFASVIRLYRRYKGDMSPADAARLRYAEHQTP
ncbi:MAG: hypothetical protein ACF8QF_07200 [Phycisphaerales bacterium]